MALKSAVIGLIAAALGIWLQAFSGSPDYPAVPPGPIILVIVALVVAFGSRWRLLPLLGAALSGLIIVGAIVRPEARRHLGEPVGAGEFVGTIIQMIGLVMGLLGGIAATARNFRTGGSPRVRV